MAQAIVISLDEDMFYCGICKNVFNTLQLFLLHKNSDCKTNNGTNEIKSESIHGSTTSASQYVLPNNTNKCDAEVKCSLCKKKFKKAKSLKAHLKIHDEKPQQCLVCGRCFLYNSHLQRHVITHKVWPDGISETTAKSVEKDLLSYTCLYCDLVLSNYNQFRLHMKNHSCLKKYKCVQGQCNSFYETVESLIHHVISAHESPTYTCHNCFEAFYYLEGLAAHFQVYNNTCIPHDPPSQQFKCLQCDAMFKKADKLSLHLLTENHKKACIHCDKVFASDKRLRLHLQIHRTYKPFQCDVCKQSFHLKKYLATHMARHVDRKFTCTICKSSFKRQDLLHRHMKSHQLRKLYKCPFKETLNCKKEFSRSDKLKMHLKYHTNRLTLNKRNTKEQHNAATKV